MYDALHKPAITEEVRWVIPARVVVVVVVVGGGLIFGYRRGAFKTNILYHLIQFKEGI